MSSMSLRPVPVFVIKKLSKYDQVCLKNGSQIFSSRGTAFVFRAITFSSAEKNNFKKKQL